VSTTTAADAASAEAAAGAGEPCSEQVRLESAYSAYYGAIRGYVARLVGQAEAEDVTQETFVKALRSSSEVRDTDKLRPWLYRVATNVALDRLRSPSRKQVSPLAFDEARLVAEGDAAVQSPKPSVESEAIRTEMSACVRAVVDRLPSAQKAALVLSDCEGFTDAEIASVVGASVGSVKIRLHRARARLRKELDGSCRIYADSRNEISCEPVVPLRSIVRR
jgi:RNA polymerase sigma-70 factor (ECF subfamily)